MGFEILLTVSFVLLLLNFISLDITVSKMKKDRLNLDVVTAITALEMATKKLNEKLKYETQSLSDYKQRLKRLEKRIDILESVHPDSDIDYGTVDDDGNIIEVWFEGKRYVPEDKRNDIDYTKTDGDGNILAVWFHGKKYVPEDKRDEDTIKLYADNKVVAETAHMANAARSDEKRCCATCQYYRPELGYTTCDLSDWLTTTKEYASMADSACNNYGAVSSDKSDVKYIRYDRMYKNLGGNGMTEQLLKRLEKLNYIYSTGLISIATYRHMVDELLQEELTHNDS